MCKKNQHPRPILITVSIGGILVQEMASFLDYEKLIIVSSVKSNKELPSHMKLAQITNAHRLLVQNGLKILKVYQSLFWEIV